MGKAASKNFSLNSSNMIFSLLEDIQDNLRRLSDIIKAALALSSLKLRRLKKLRSKLETKLNARIEGKIYLDKNNGYHYARIRQGTKLLKRYLGKTPEEEISLISEYNQTLDDIKALERYMDRVTDALTDINSDISMLIEEPEYMFPDELKEVELNE